MHVLEKVVYMGALCRNVAVYMRELRSGFCIVSEEEDIYMRRRIHTEMSLYICGSCGAASA